MLSIEKRRRRKRIAGCVGNRAGIAKSVFVSSIDRNFMKKVFCIRLKKIKEFFVEKNFERYAIFLQIFFEVFEKIWLTFI